MTTDEAARRLVHVGGAVFPLAYLIDLHVLPNADLLTWPRLQVVYLLGSALAIILETVRLGIGLDWWIYRRLTRDYEQDNPAGYALYTLGATVAVVVFEPPIAIPAILALAFVDPISGALSRRGHRETKRSSVLAVTFALSAVLALAFVPLPAALLGGVAVMVADGVKPTIAGYVLDDNFTIPVAASVAMWAGLQAIP